MNKSDAKRIAETITNEQLNQMFINAKEKITDWTVRSSVNKGCTKGAAWNILGQGFDINHKHHIMAKINMIREFGDYLPSELMPVNPSRNTIRGGGVIVHQDPIFD